MIFIKPKNEFTFIPGKGRILNPPVNSINLWSLVKQNMMVEVYSTDIIGYRSVEYPSIIFKSMHGDLVEWVYLDVESRDSEFDEILNFNPDRY